MTTHYSILVWKLHGQKNLVRYSPEGQERVRYDWVTKQQQQIDIDIDCSAAQSCLTLCNPMYWGMPGFPVLHYLPEFAQTHVHSVCDTVQPSCLLSPPSPPAINLSQHLGLFQWVGSSHQVAKVLELHLQHPYITTEKTISLTRWTFVSKVTSLLFDMISRFVITFLLRIKHLLISWLAVTICSDFGAQENKACHCFHCFPIYLPWSDGTGCHDICSLNVEF